MSNVIWTKLTGTSFGVIVWCFVPGLPQDHRSVRPTVRSTSWSRFQGIERSTCILPGGGEDWPWDVPGTPSGIPSLSVLDLATYYFYLFLFFI